MITILLADPQGLVREGVRRLLEECSDLTVLGEASDGHACLRLVQQLRPDVVVMGLALPGLDGIEVTKQIANERLGTRVLILTMYAREAYAGHVLHAGARGFIGKQASRHELIQAIRTIAAGRYYLPSAFAETLGKQDNWRDTTAASPLDLLSDREVQVLTRLAYDATSRIIAQELSMNAKTVEYYRARLLAKLHMQTTADLIRFALRHRLIDEASESISDASRSCP